jgi:hypothetical protein
LYSVLNLQETHQVIRRQAGLSGGCQIIKQNLLSEDEPGYQEAIRRHTRFSGDTMGHQESCRLSNTTGIIRRQGGLSRDIPDYQPLQAIRRHTKNQETCRVIRSHIGYKKQLVIRRCTWLSGDKLGYHETHWPVKRHTGIYGGTQSYQETCQVIKS